MKHFMDIERLKRNENEFCNANCGVFHVGDIIQISEKVDGSNSSIEYVDGKLIAYSRKQELNFNNTLAGFWNYVQNFDAEKWAEDYISFEKEQLKKQQDEIVKRRLTVAELDKRKILLKKKQQLIDEIINEIYQKMLKTDKKKYLEFVEKNIEASCDNSDEIILSKDLNGYELLSINLK